ncbi:MAG: hypothetical protein ACM3ML_37520 [Micromonosporaceae bacterium]
MSGPVSPDEIRATAETYHGAGPGYRDAVIESFPDKVSREIDARPDTRLAQQAAHVRQCHGKGAGLQHRYYVLVSSGTGNALSKVTDDRQSGSVVQVSSGNGDATVLPPPHNTVPQARSRTNEQPTTRCW